MSSFVSPFCYTWGSFRAEFYLSKKKLGNGGSFHIALGAGVELTSTFRHIHVGTAVIVLFDLPKYPIKTLNSKIDFLKGLETSNFFVFFT